jgi:hypothetical protein
MLDLNVVQLAPLLRKEKEAWTTKRRAGQKSENGVAEGDKKGKERAQ